MQHYGAILNMELVVVSVISVCKIQQNTTTAAKKEPKLDNTRSTLRCVLQLYVNGDRVTIHRAEELELQRDRETRTEKMVYE